MYFLIETSAVVVLSETPIVNGRGHPPLELVTSAVSGGTFRLES